MAKYQFRPPITHTPEPWKDEKLDCGTLYLRVGHMKWFPNDTNDPQVKRQQEIDGRLMSYVPEMYALLHKIAMTDDGSSFAEKAQEIIGKIDGSFWS